MAFTLKHYFKIPFIWIDAPTEGASSAVAAGIFNPITGKRMVKTWMADTFFPYLHSFYSCAEKILGAKFFYPQPIYKIFDSVEEQNEWVARSADEAYANYVEVLPADENLPHYIKSPYGMLHIKQGGRLDCIKFIEAVKSYCAKDGCLLNGIFYESGSVLGIDKQKELFVIDIGNDWLIDCRGYVCARSEWWQHLPWQLNKGEVVEANVNFLPNGIFTKGVFVCPDALNFIKIGATYVWNELSPSVSSERVNDMLSKSAAYFSSPLEIKNIKWGIRPATKYRRPFCEAHPSIKNVFIFGGFGSKGVSLAPWLAKEWCEKWLN